MRFVYITIFIFLPVLNAAQPPEILEMKAFNDNTRRIYSRILSKKMTFSCAVVDHFTKAPTLSVWISDSCGVMVNSAEITGPFSNQVNHVWKVDTNFNGDYIIAFSYDYNVNLGRENEFVNILFLRKDLKDVSTINSRSPLDWWKFSHQFDVFENGIVHRGSNTNNVVSSSIVIRDFSSKIQDEFRLTHIPDRNQDFVGFKMLNTGHLLLSQHFERSDESSLALVLIDTAKNRIIGISEVPFRKKYSSTPWDFITIWESNIYVFRSFFDDVILYKFSDQLELLESWSLGLPQGQDFAVDGNSVHIFGNGRHRDNHERIASYAIWDFQKERITSAFKLPQHLQQNSFSNSLTVHNNQVYLHYSNANTGITALLSPDSPCDSLLDFMEVPDQISLKLKSQVGFMENYSLRANKLVSVKMLGISSPSPYNFQVVSTCPTDYFQKSLPVFDTAVCTGVVGTLTSRFPIDLKWNTGDSSVSITSDTSGLFVGKGEMGLCSVTDSQRLFIIDSINLRLPDDSSVCPGSEVLFYPSSRDYQLKWSFPNGNEKIGYSYAVNDDGVHYVSAYGGGCKVFDSVNFSLYPKPIADAGKDTSLCLGDSIHLSVTGGEIYSWLPVDEMSDPEESKPLVHPSDDRVYTVKAINGHGCSDTNSVFVKVLMPPTADFLIPRYVSVSTRDVQLTSKSTNTRSFNWLVNGESISRDENTLYEFPDSGDYMITLKVLGEGYCTDSVSQPIRIDPIPLMWVPNAFTPNGDGINDLFGPSTFMIDQYSMTIFSTSGQLVWQSNFSSPYPLWDGIMDNMEREEAPTGVYVFIVQGFDDNGFPKTVEGKVHLVR